MTRPSLLLATAGPLLALLAQPAPAADPFHGFFQPRGGRYYTPLHFWSPAGYKVHYWKYGPECRGWPVSVCPPRRPAQGPEVAPAAPAKPEGKSERPKSDGPAERPKPDAPAEQPKP
jgi:hypothetical protein